MYFIRPAPGHRDYMKPLQRNNQRLRFAVVVAGGGYPAAAAAAARVYQAQEERRSTCLC